MTIKEVEKNFREIWELFKDTDRKFKDTDRKFKDTDRKFKDTDRKFKDTDRKFQETDRRLKENVQQLEKEIAAVTKSIGDLGGKWGRFVEGIIAPSVKEMFQARGIKVERIYPRAESYRNGQAIEIDLLAVNGEEAVVIEAKSTLSVEDIREFMERLPLFKQFFPEYGDRRVYGAVAGIVLDRGADRFAYKNGLFVIGQKGEMVRILNDEKFQPKVW